MLDQRATTSGAVQLVGSDGTSHGDTVPCELSKDRNKNV